MGMSRAQRTRGVKEILKGMPKGEMGMRRFKQVLKAEGLTRQAQKKILAAVGKEAPKPSTAEITSPKPTYFEKKEAAPKGLKEKEITKPPKVAGYVELERKIKAGEEVAREVLGRHVEKERKPATLFGRPITGITGIPTDHAREIEQKLSKEALEKLEHERLRELERKRRLEFQKEQEKERKTIEDLETQEKETEQYFTDLMNKTFKKGK
jgi:hypothetical protein